MCTMPLLTAHPGPCKQPLDLTLLTAHPVSSLWTAPNVLFTLFGLQQCILNYKGSPGFTLAWLAVSSNGKDSVRGLIANEN